jgi:hypothetical protein
MDGEDDLDFETPFSQMDAWTIIAAYFEEHGLVRQQCVPPRSCPARLLLLPCALPLGPFSPQRAPPSHSASLPPLPLHHHHLPQVGLFQ